MMWTAMMWTDVRRCRCCSTVRPAVKAATVALCPVGSVDWNDQIVRRCDRPMGRTVLPDRRIHSAGRTWKLAVRPLLPDGQCHRDALREHHCSYRWGNSVAVVFHAAFHRGSLPCAGRDRRRIRLAADPAGSACCCCHFGAMAVVHCRFPPPFRGIGRRGRSGSSALDDWSPVRAAPWETLRCRWNFAAEDLPDLCLPGWKIQAADRSRSGGWGTARYPAVCCGEVHAVRGPSCWEPLLPKADARAVKDHHLGHCPGASGHPVETSAVVPEYLAWRPDST